MPAGTPAVTTGARAPATFGMEEVPLSGGNGRRALLLAGASLAAAAVFAALAIGSRGGGGAVAARSAAAAILAGASLSGFRGLTRVEQGDAVVVQLFGSYIGTIRAPGLRWANPWSKRRAVSVKIRTYETALAKVNDADGNPLEISVAVVWRVTNTARALFSVDDFARYLAMQTDAAVRQVAASYRYDNQGHLAPSLARSTDEVAQRLSAEISRRVEPAGVTVIESQVVRMAYAPEVAQALLRRQQAAAIVAARQQIVEGAVGMVELALQRLTEGNLVDLDEERKAAMVSNLLVVLCSDHPTEPIVNAGSLYH